MGRLRDLPWPLRLLLVLAAGEYLSKGLFLGLFTNGFDFAPYYNAALQTAHGDGARVYDSFFAYVPGTTPVPMYFLYPAPVAALMAPLGLLTFHGALAVFQLLGHVCVWGALALWCRGKPPERRALGVALVFLYYPLYYSLLVGQAEPFILLCLFGAEALQTKDRAPWAGLCLALAIALKLFLLLLLPYLVLRRAWKLAAWTAAWLAALFALGGAAVPWAVQAEYWRRVGASLGIEAFTDNLSITGFAARALTTTRYAAGLVDSPAAALAVRAVLSVLVLGGFVWTCLKTRERGLFGRGLGLTVATALLLTPIADSHHLTLLLPGFLAWLDDDGRPAWALGLYAFFARFEPLVGYKFIAAERVAFWATAPFSLLHALPFVALCALWVYTVRGLLQRARRAE